MVKVINSEKLVSLLRGYYPNIYPQPQNFYSPDIDPNVNLHINNILNNVMKSSYQAVTNEIMNFKYQLISYIEEASVEENTCLLCKPGNDGLIPGFNPEDLPD